MLGKDPTKVKKWEYLPKSWQECSLKWFGIYSLRKNNLTWNFSNVNVTRSFIAKQTKPNHEITSQEPLKIWSQCTEKDRYCQENQYWEQVQSEFNWIVPSADSFWYVAEQVTTDESSEEKGGLSPRCQVWMVAVKMEFLRDWDLVKVKQLICGTGSDLDKVCINERAGDGLSTSNKYIC